MISKEEVEHIAKLARIGLPEEKIEKMGNEISKVLDYVEKLKEVDVEGIEPLSHPVDVKNVTREDKERPKTKDQRPEIRDERRKKLLEMIPETTNGYLKTKAIL